MANTSLSITPFFLRAQQITSLGTRSNTFSRLTNSIHNFLSAISYHFSWDTIKYFFQINKFHTQFSSCNFIYKIASLDLFPGMNLICILSSFTSFLSRFLNTLSITFNPCSKTLHFCNFHMILHLFLSRTGIKLLLLQLSGIFFS